MQAWEAINLLQGMPLNTEVTIIIGKANIISNPPMPFTPVPVRPTWAPNISPFNPNIVTCNNKSNKVH